MPFIGNKPSAVPLTSADIADSIITSAKIVDGTIANADINSSAAIALTKLASTGTLTVDNIQFPTTQVASANGNTLDDYEEGTFTPSQGSGIVLVGTFGSSGTYIKIGRMIIISGSITGTTSVSISAGSQLFTNLPFTVSVTGGGVASNGNLTAGGILIPFSTQVFSVTTFSATNSIDYTLKYITS